MCVEVGEGAQQEQEQGVRAWRRLQEEQALPCVEHPPMRACVCMIMKEGARHVAAAVQMSAAGLERHSAAAATAAACGNCRPCPARVPWGTCSPLWPPHHPSPRRPCTACIPIPRENERDQQLPPPAPATRHHHHLGRATHCVGARAHQLLRKLHHVRVVSIRLWRRQACRRLADGQYGA